MEVLTYSSVPNRRVGRNKRAGGKILKKTLNVQDIIDVQGGKFSLKTLNVQDEINVQGGKFRRPDIYKLQKKGKPMSPKVSQTKHIT